MLCCAMSCNARIRAHSPRINGLSAEIARSRAAAGAGGGRQQIDSNVGIAPRGLTDCVGRRPTWQNSPLLLPASSTGAPTAIHGIQSLNRHFPAACDAANPHD